MDRDRAYGSGPAGVCGLHGDLVLQRRWVSDGRWRQAGEYTTNQWGAAAVDVTPRRDAYYRWVFLGDDTTRYDDSGPLRVNR